jgi:hypothetical protein
MELQSPNNLLDEGWVSCDLCSKWRRIPVNNIPYNQFGYWYCHLNPNNNENNCIGKLFTIILLKMF